ncbi:MAG: hypothetical protein ACK52I_21310, partial [Pseudomonadota bacterium]
GVATGRPARPARGFRPGWVSSSVNRFVPGPSAFVPRGSSYPGGTSSKRVPRRRPDAPQHAAGRHTHRG